MLRENSISFINNGNAMESVSVYTGQFFDVDGNNYFFGATNSSSGLRVFRFDPRVKAVDWIVPVKCHYIVDDNMCQNIVDLK